MAYTVRLVEEPSGWFATLRRPWPLPPGAKVRWESEFEVEAQAVSVLGLADLLARKLTEGSFSWRGEAEEVLGLRPRAAMGPDAMRFDVYGLFQLEVRKTAEGWEVLRVGEGRFREAGIVIPSDIPAEGVERYLDDLLHEGAAQGRRLRRLD